QQETHVHLLFNEASWSVSLEKAAGERPEEKGAEMYTGTEEGREKNWSSSNGAANVPLKIYRFFIMELCSFYCR
ncbi:hypothetical protein ANCCAN_29707, partial [Ancylostoma caninum]